MNSDIYFDNYMGFTWNGVHSSSYNCFITNTGDLKFSNYPSFSNNFTSPSFQTKSYYTGTTTNTRTINLSLCTYKLTLDEYNDFLEWINIYTLSQLSLDYDPWYVYNVKLSSVSESTKYVVGHRKIDGISTDIYTCTLTVAFQTVGDPYGISTYGIMCNTGISGNTVLLNGNVFNWGSVVGDEYKKYLDDNSQEIIEWNYGNLWFLNKYALSTSGDKKYLCTIKRTKTPKINDTYDTYVYRIIINNYGSIKIPFKVFIYNVNNVISINSIQNDTDTIVDSLLYTQLNNVVYDSTKGILDKNHTIDLYYNSEFGTVVSCNKLIEKLMSREDFVCLANKTQANEFINPHTKRTFDITVTNLQKTEEIPEIEIQFNNKNYIV